MKDSLSQAVKAMGEWTAFLSQKHTEQEIMEYRKRPEHLEVVAGLLQTTKNVIQVIAEYPFRPLPHTFNYPKILRCLGLAYRQV